MTLEEFKFIYWMEYAHRMWGRVLGVVFAGPALYFAARGWINSALARRLGLLFLMGGAQGLVGWWMVRSGLQVSSPLASSIGVVTNVQPLAFVLHRLRLSCTVTCGCPAQTMAPRTCDLVWTAALAVVRRTDGPHCPSQCCKWSS